MKPTYNTAGYTKEEYTAKLQTLSDREHTPLTDEELNIAVAEKVMGRKVVALDWPCRRDMECGELEAHTCANPDGTPANDVFEMRALYRVPHAVYLVDPDDPWPPLPNANGECWVNLEPVEDFVNDWRAFGLVVEAMERRGYYYFRSWNASTGYAAVFEGKGRGGYAHDTTRLRAACLAAIRAVESEERRG